MVTLRRIPSGFNFADKKKPRNRGALAEEERYPENPQAIVRARQTGRWSNGMLT